MGSSSISTRGSAPIVLDLETPADRDRLRELVASADVLVDDRPPSELRRLGLTYEELSSINPDLVMISITPFGQTGPYAEWKGYDLNAFHLSGSSSRYLGRPGETPLEPGTFAADYMAGAAGAAWGLGAVFGRDRVGGGQHVDVSAAEVSAALFTGALNITTYRQTGIAEKRTGQGMVITAPAGVMPTKDGHVWMLTVEPRHWKGLATAMGDPEWMADPDLTANMFARGAQSEMIYGKVGEWLAERTSREAMDVCQANGVPTTAIMPASAIAEHCRTWRSGASSRRSIIPASGPFPGSGCRSGSPRTTGSPALPLPSSVPTPPRSSPTSGPDGGSRSRR